MAFDWLGIGAAESLRGLSARTMTSFFAKLQSSPSHTTVLSRLVSVNTGSTTEKHEMEPQHIAASAATPHKRDIWRQAPTGAGERCQPVHIPGGMIYVNGTQVRVSNATFTPDCHNGFLPSGSIKGNSFLTLLRGNTIMTDPKTNSTAMNMTALQNWQIPFVTSTVPLTYAISSATVIIWMLFITLILTANRRPFFLIAVTMATVICITTYSAETLALFKSQYCHGYQDGSNLEVDITRPKIAVFWAIANCALLLAEVRTVVRLVERRREKLILFYIGVGLTIISGVFYILNIFAPSPEERDNSLDAIMVLGYLFSMATTILFNAYIIFHTITHYRIVLRMEMIVKTVVCNVCALLPTILFIMDLLRADIDDWAQLAGLAATMSASLSAWVWIDRLKEIQRRLRDNSVLGRPYYQEDGPSDFGHYDNDDDDKDNDAAIDDSKHTNSTVVQEKPSQPRLLSFLTHDFWHIKRPKTTDSTDTAYIVTNEDPNTNLHSNPTNDTNAQPPQQQQQMSIYNHPLRVSRNIAQQN